MPTPPLSDELAQEAVDAWRAAGKSRKRAAESIGIPKATFESRLNIGIKRGLAGPMPPAQSGFEVKAYSEQHDKDGNLKSRSTRYAHEPGPETPLPDGTVHKRGTLQVGPDGRTERHWIKYSPDELGPERAADIIRAAFEDWKPFAPAIARVKNLDEERLSVYVLADWHVGMFAYGKETDGPDWDLKIARTILTETFHELVETTPRSAHAVVLGLGDLMHADSHKNQTPSSGNIMDVDTRYSKVLPVTCDIIADCCEMVRANHRHVEVEFKPGNHDISSTVGIRSALRMFYRNDERVRVHDTPSPFFWKRFGVNLIGGCHGDGIRVKDLPLMMANVRSADWADTKSKHAHTGHRHHELTFEAGGVKVHQHRAPIPADAYHNANGYRSGRSMRAFHYRRTRGARGSSEVEIL